MKEKGMKIPKLLRCPISLEIFNDPVTLCTGQTYDRACIQKWFSQGNITCPITMQILDDLSLLPNHTLTHLITQYNYHDDDDDKDNDIPNNRLCNNDNVSLKHVLESKDSTLSMKIQAIENLEGEIEGVLEMGVFQILLGLIFGAKVTQEMMILVEKSLGCVLKLMQFCCMKDLDFIMEESKFENFKVLFQDGSLLVKVRLCNLIQVIFTSLDENLLANKIANDNKLMQMLINLLNDDHQQQHSSKVLEASINTILSILSTSSQEISLFRHRENLIKQGLIKSLVKYIMEIDGKTTNYGGKATKALELVLELESGKQVFLGDNNRVEKGVKALIKMVFRVSGDDYGSENAVNCLMILCRESVLVRENAICGGILTQLLLLLQSQCNGRVKTRARLLLKLLRSMWVKDQTHI